MLAARVTVPDGNVAVVAAVDVNVNAKLPDVEKLLAMSMLPASLIVLVALVTSNVNVRPAVKATELVAASVKSNAALVSRRANVPTLVILVDVPEKVGLLLKTKFPVPVAPVEVTPSNVTWPVTERVPLIVTPSAALVVTIFRIPVLPVASILNADASLSAKVQI